MKDNIKFLLKRFSPIINILVFLWASFFLFIVLDGFSRYWNILSWDFLFHGLYNNRFVVLVPIWIAIFYRAYLKNDIHIYNFLKNKWVLLLIISIFLENIITLFNSGDATYYISLLVITFFIGIFVLSPIFFLLNDEKFHLFNWKSFANKNNINIDLWKTEKISNLIYIVVLLLVVIRFLGIENLFPTTDEYLHLNFAKNQVFPSLQLYEVDKYTRFPFLNNLLIELFTWFQPSVWLARLPGIIFSMISSLLMFIFIKRENQKLASISAIMLLASPWVIMLSRTIREYIYLLSFYILLNFYLYYRVKGFLKKGIDSKVFVDILIFGLFLIYILVLDPLSTAKFGILFYIVAFVYGLISWLSKKYEYKVLRRYSVVTIFFVVIYVCLLLLTTFTSLTFEISQINILPILNLSWIKYLFFGGEHSGLILGGIFFVFGMIKILYDFIKNHKMDVGFYSLLTVFILLFVYTFHFARYYRPRYISIIIPWFTIVSAYGFNVFAFLIKDYFKIFKGGFYLLFVLCLNWVYIGYSFLSQESGYVAISHEFQEPVKEVVKFMSEQELLNSETILLTTVSEGFDWYIDDNNIQIYHLNYTEDSLDNMISSIPQTLDKGFLIIDKRRLNWSSFPLEDNSGFSIRLSSRVKLVYLDTYMEYSIYEWSY